MDRHFEVLDGRSFGECGYPICKHYHSALGRTRMLLDRALPHVTPGKRPVFYGVGTSGAMMIMLIKTMDASLYTALLNPKSKESRHRSFISGDINISAHPDNVRNHFHGDQYYHVFVDDLLCTGGTLEGVLEYINYLCSPPTQKQWFDFDMILTLNSQHGNKHKFPASHFITVD